MFFHPPMTLPNLENIQIVYVVGVPAPVWGTQHMLGPLSLGWPLSSVAPPSISKVVRGTSTGLNEE
jgi:hypothetical protein